MLHVWNKAHVLQIPDSGGNREGYLSYAAKNEVIVSGNYFIVHMLQSIQIYQTYYFAFRPHEMFYHPKTSCDICRPISSISFPPCIACYLVSFSVMHDLTHFPCTVIENPFQIQIADIQNKNFTFPLGLCLKISPRMNGHISQQGILRALH